MAQQIRCISTRAIVVSFVVLLFIHIFLQKLHILKHLVTINKSYKYQIDDEEE